jgi:hypothetical protein
MTGKSLKESAISSLERSRNATELLVKRQNVRYPNSRETVEIEHLGPGVNPETQRRDTMTLLLADAQFLGDA